ncbi:rare lipoprotein A [Azospirillum fermentarium]|uniref:septal ring lytic transglycosylase RlpA family protein n=1 Tax=Azospirillum fermentarium TaxID=1233114 RepID=UPI0022260313|nr:septal ring lytic transglycosylase RlpA family protein [Azospirillum fermentarium]MCW2245899.1 rare lipoprotein A [Azospirillum fermentarium]
MEFPRTTFRLAAAGIVLFSTVTVPVADAMDTRSGKDLNLASFHQTGKASWYGGGFHGRETASGTPFNQHALTAAHRSLPLGTEVVVTNVDNGKSVTVTINDRGPYVRGRIIDLSRRAARDLGFVGDGLAKVAITVSAPPESTVPPVPQAKPAPAPADLQVAAVPGDEDDSER